MGSTDFAHRSIRAVRPEFLDRFTVAFLDSPRGSENEGLGQMARRTFVTGFTLVELMVTLAIVAILLAAAAPSFSDFFDRYRLRGAADDAVSLIANARTAAVEHNREVNIDFGGTTANWCIGANAAEDPATPGQPYPAAASCDCTKNDECLVQGQRLAIDQGTHGSVSVDAVTASYTFNNKLGTATSGGSIVAPAEVVFTSPSGKYDLKLQVSALGQARVCVPAGEPAIAGVSSC